MIVDFNVKYLSSVYNLGNNLNINYESLYNEESLNQGVNKTFVYNLNNDVVGFIHIQDFDDEIDIISVVIDEKFRNRGFASKLMDYVVNYSNGRKIILEVNGNNKAAIGLYKKYGFKDVGIRKGYYNGEDAIVMEKKW